MTEHTLIQILGIGIVYYTGHPLHVLTGLFLDYRQDIIYSDDPHQPVFIINYRNGEKAVFLEALRYLLLVIVDVDIHIVGVHQVIDLRIIIGYHKGTKGYDTLQLPAAPLDIASIDGLTVHALALYVSQRLSHRHGLLKTDVVGSHQASCAGVGIVEKGVYQLPLFLRRALQYLIHDVCRQLFQHVYLIVEVQLVYDVGYFPVGYAMDDGYLVVGGKM